MYVIIKNDDFEDKKEYYCMEKLNPLILANTLNISNYFAIKLCKKRYLKLFPMTFSIKKTKELEDFKYYTLPINEQSYIELYLKCVTPECEPLDILYLLFMYDFKFKISTKDSIILNYSDDIVDISITDLSIELTFNKDIKSETGNFYFEIKKFKIDLDSYSKDFLSAQI